MDPYKSQFKVSVALIGACVACAVVFHLVHVRITWKRYMTYVRSVVLDAVDLYHTSLQDNNTVVRLVHILGAESRLDIVQQMMPPSDVASHTGVDIVDLSARVKDSRYRSARLLQNSLMYIKQQESGPSQYAAPVHRNQPVRGDGR